MYRGWHRDLSSALVDVRWSDMTVLGMIAYAAGICFVIGLGWIVVVMFERADRD